jgi:hypothetical protein
MAGIVIALGGCSWHKHAENTIRFNLLRGGSMKPNRSASSSRQRARTLLLAIVVGTAFLSSSVASAKPPFLAFNYAASPVLTNPGQDSQACMDTGVPLCPSGHSCEVFAYSGTGMGTPGFGNTNIEVCILEDRNLGLPNATGGDCSQSSGSAQITYQIKRHSQKVFVLGLLGDTCVANGASIASVVQNMSLTQGPWAGTLSISSLVTDGATAFLSIYGTIQSGL